MSDVANNELLLVTSLGRATGDGDGSTVHVHLTVANVIEPSPGKNSLAGREGCGNGEAVSVWIRSRSTVAQVAGSVSCRTSSFDGMDDLKDTVLSRGVVISDGDLAGATTMSGLTSELKRLGGSESHLSGGSSSVELEFAGKVRSMTVKGRVVGISGKPSRLCQRHVSAGVRRKAENGYGSSCEQHFEFCCEYSCRTKISVCVELCAKVR